MAISAEHQNFIQPRFFAESEPRSRLQQLIDAGAVYIAQNLSPSQFAVLQAIAARMFKRRDANRLADRIDAALAVSSGDIPIFTPPPPLAIDYQLGLDELDTMSRVRTGYPFAELPTEIQDAILDLIATRDLTTRKLDLALWLERLHTSAPSL